MYTTHTCGDNVCVHRYWTLYTHGWQEKPGALIVPYEWGSLGIRYTKNTVGSVVTARVSHNVYHITCGTQHVVLMLSLNFHVAGNYSGGNFNSFHVLWS